MAVTLIVHAQVPKIISDDIEIFSIGNCPLLQVCARSMQNKLCLGKTDHIGYIGGYFSSMSVRHSR